MLTFNTPEFIINITVNPLILWAVFAVAIIIFGITATALFLDLQRFAFNQKIIDRTTVFFFIVAGALIIINAVSIVLFSATLPL